MQGLLATHATPPNTNARSHNLEQAGSRSQTLPAPHRIFLVVYTRRRVETRRPRPADGRISQIPFSSPPRQGGLVFRTPKTANNALAHNPSSTQLLAVENFRLVANLLHAAPRAR